MQLGSIIKTINFKRNFNAPLTNGFCTKTKGVKRNLSSLNLDGSYYTIDDQSSSSQLSQIYTTEHTPELARSDNQSAEKIKAEQIYAPSRTLNIHRPEHPYGDWKEYGESSTTPSQQEQEMKLWSEQAECLEKFDHHFVSPEEVAIEQSESLEIFDKLKEEDCDPEEDDKNLI